MPGERLSGAFADSWPAAADLRTHQYKYVKLTTTGVDVCAAGDPIDGVLQNDPNTGQAACVMVQGLSHLVVDGSVGGGIAAGDPLEVATGGVGIKSTTDKKNVSAIAVDPATVAGAIISVELLGRRQASV
jgi:hypothetical protein